MRVLSIETKWLKKKNHKSFPTLMLQKFNIYQELLIIHIHRCSENGKHLDFYFLLRQASIIKVSVVFVLFAQQNDQPVSAWHDWWKDHK